MSELEERIRRWKSDLDHAEPLRESDVTELEQHLRDSIDALRDAGLDDEEAFLVASRRLGRPGLLASEFGKVNGSYVWTNRLFWMLAGFLFVEIARSAIGALAGLGQALGAMAGGSSALLGYLPLAIHCASWLAIAIWLWRGSRVDVEGHAVARFLRRSPARVIALLAGTTMVVGTLLRFHSKLTFVRLAPAEAVGETALISVWISTLIAPAVTVLLLVLMLTLRRQARAISTQNATL